MRKLIIYIFIAIIFSNSVNALNVGIRCHHAGIAYIDIPLNATCPDYAGSDAGIQSGWEHAHKGDNSNSYHINPNGDHIDEGDQEHCLITKAFVEGPPREIQ